MQAWKMIVKNKNSIDHHALITLIDIKLIDQIDYLIIVNAGKN